MVSCVHGAIAFRLGSRTHLRTVQQHCYQRILHEETEVVEDYLAQKLEGGREVILALN